MSLHVPPYPPPRFTGDTGEVSATLRRGDAPADYESWGMKYSYLASRQSTDGDFGLYRVDIGPAAGGPGPHFHKAMSESFFVLSGHMRLYDGRDWVDGAAGDYLYVPPGGIHGFRNEADDVVCSGCAARVLLRGLGKVGDLTDDERREFFVRNDNFFV